MKPTALELRDVHFAYKVHDQSVPALRGLSLRVEEGEMVAIQGPSGSGKSTLLYLLGCMLAPDKGDVRIFGQKVSDLKDVELAYFRNRKLGFVFQQFHLLPSSDVLSNILLPTHYPLEQAEVDPIDYQARAIELAKKLGLSERLDHTPQQLSGGQQQRVAIARALIRDAPIILADEPTGNLDSKTASEILELLRELNQSGKTVVIITHDQEIASRCDRTIHIRDGQVQGPAPQPIQEQQNSQAGVSLRQMSLWEICRHSFPQAFNNLRRNRLRSALTMLGVVVGVASILAMLTLGTFTKKKIVESYALMGVNTLVFRANPNWYMRAADRPPSSFYGLDLDRDVWPLREIFPEIRLISPIFESHGHTAIYGGRIVENEVNVVGVNDQAFKITGRELAIGAGIRPFHVQNRSSVCVIGFELANRLFQRQNPLGHAIQVAIEENTFSCVIVGVTKRIASKDSRWGPNLQVTIPYTYFSNLPFGWWRKQLRDMLLHVDTRADVEVAGSKIQAFFQKRYGNSGIFRASSDSVLLAQMKRFLNLFTLLLVSISALSLLVGGMGITNMMLVSINERLREIGLRKALGASHLAIRQLFFAEAMFLCVVAGLLGLVAGFISYQGLIYAGSKFIKDLSFEWVFNPLAFMMAFVAIVLTGLLSGLGPAMRAEKLQVIEALRSE